MSNLGFVERRRREECSLLFGSEFKSCFYGNSKGQSSPSRVRQSYKLGYLYERARSGSARSYGSAVFSL